MCAARPGAGCAIWPTKVVGLDRRRYEHSGLRSQRIPVSRSSRDANCGTRRRIRDLVDPLALRSRVSRHSHPSPHLCAADALAAGFRPSGRLARVAHPRAIGGVGKPLAGAANDFRKGTNCRTAIPSRAHRGLCQQHGVRELWSADRDFNRFPGLVIVNPLVG